MKALAHTLAAAITASTRMESVTLAIVLLGAWVLRALPFFREGGALAWPVDYDEGVYLSSAHALLVGLRPWKDFVLVHPPGALFAFLPFTMIEPRQAISALRWSVTFLGTANVALVYVTVRNANALRTNGSFLGAILAAALYACWPEVCQAERRALLEPLLNFACLGAVFLLARGAKASTIGIALGVAISVKTWAAMWIVGATIAIPTWRAKIQFSLWVGVTFLVLNAWLLASHPVEALMQMIQMQAVRPPDGDLSRFLRLNEMFVARSWAPIALLLTSGWWLFKERVQPLVRALAAAFALIVAAFLFAAAWWNQYDAHLAAAMAPLVGLGISLAIPRPRLFMFMLLLLILIPGIRAVVMSHRDRDDAQVERSTRLMARKQLKGRVCAFEPADAILADHWPVAIFDSYGQALLDTARSGKRFAHVSDAWADNVSQLGIRKSFESCDVIVRAWRGGWQMNAETKALFQNTFLEVTPEIFERR
jgi:hypothetical protein